MSAWMLPEDFLFQFSHSIKAGVVWVLCCSGHIGMHMVQTWIPHLTKQVLDLGMLVHILFVATADGRMGIVHLVFKLGPVHMGFVFARAVQVLKSSFHLDQLLGTHAKTIMMMNKGWPF